MSNKPRPGLQRRETRSTAEAKKAAMDTGVRVTWKGRAYEVRAGDLSGIHARALRQELGLSFTELVLALRRSPDLDIFAGIIWLSEIVHNRPVDLDEILAKMTYADLDDLMDAFEGVEGPEDTRGDGPEGSIDPEA